MKKLHLLKSMLLLCALIVESGMTWAADNILSWSYKDTITEGYNLTVTASNNSNNNCYQDGTGTAGIKLYHSSKALFDKTPTSITFTAKVGGGTGNKDLASSVYVSFVDNTGTVVEGTETEVTKHITTNTGDTYNISMPTAKATQAYGVYIYHTKESGYNVRYYSFSLTAVVPTKDPIGTFDAISDIEIAVGANQAFDASDYFTIDGDATGSATLSVTPAEGDGTYAYYDDGKIYGTAYGTEEFTITATPAAADEETYGTVTKTFNVKVLKVPSYSDIMDESIAYDETLTISVPSAAGDISSVTSSNTNVATVAGNVITAVAVGTSTITVNTVKDSEYIAGSTTFVLTVTAPNGSTTKPSADPVTIFSETFDGCDGTGGNDDDGWSGSIASANLTQGTSTSTTGWTFTNEKAANECAKFGTGSAGGSAKTPAMDLENGVIYTLTFRAAAWDGTKEGTTLSVSADNATIRNEANDANVSSVTLTKGAWTTYTLKLINGSDKAQITFSTDGGNKRFFLDDVKVTKPGTPINTTTATVAASKFGTYCYEYPLDLDELDEDVKAYIVTKIDAADVTFTNVTGTIKGGVPFILYGTAGSHTLTLTASSSTVPDGNLLQGTLAPTYIETVTGDYTNFGLSGGKFVKINAGTIPAHKAYLPIETTKVPAVGGAHEFGIIFEDNGTTGIANVRKQSADMRDEYYNLSGQRVAQPTKGLYIVNGRKVVIK